MADQEIESIKRRTREGLERARQQGKTLGPPRKLKPGQLEAVRRMREGGQPAADCRGLRVLSQHRPQDIAAGRSGAMTDPKRIPRLTGATCTSRVR